MDTDNEFDRFISLLIGSTVCIQVVAIILKLMHYIEVSWLMVFLPILAIMGLFLLIFIVVLVGVVISYFINNRED